jgi:hypothetical protein
VRRGPCLGLRRARARASLPRARPGASSASASASDAAAASASRPRSSSASSSCCCSASSAARRRRGGLGPFQLGFLTGAELLQTLVHSLLDPLRQLCVFGADKDLVVCVSVWFIFWMSRVFGGMIDIPHAPVACSSRSLRRCRYESRGAVTPALYTTREREREREREIER